MSTTPTMKRLSTGQPSTLKSYLELTSALLGAESKAAQFLRQKIADNPNGEDEVVVADESQMLYILMNMDWVAK